MYGARMAVVNNGRDALCVIYLQINVKDKVSHTRAAEENMSSVKLNGPPSYGGDLWP